MARRPPGPLACRPAFMGSYDGHTGWANTKALAMAGIAACSWTLVWLRLPETNLRRDPHASFGKVASAFPILLRNRAFLAYTLSSCATSANFFAFVAAAPHVVVESMHREPHVYAGWFAVMSIGYATGNFISGRYASRIGSDRMIVAGSWLTLVAALLQGAWAIYGPWTPATLFAPGFLIAIGNGVAIPSAMAAALSVRPDFAGAASGLAGSLQLGTAASVAFIAGRVVPDAPRGIVVITILCAVAGLLALPLQRASRSPSL